MRAAIDGVYVVSSIIDEIDPVDTKELNTFPLQCTENVNLVRKHKDIMLLTLKNILYKIAVFSFSICLLHGSNFDKSFDATLWWFVVRA